MCSSIYVKADDQYLKLHGREAACTASRKRRPCCHCKRIGFAYNFVTDCINPSVRRSRTPVRVLWLVFSTFLLFQILYEYRKKVGTVACTVRGTIVKVHHQTSARPNARDCSRRRDRVRVEWVLANIRDICIFSTSVGRCFRCVQLWRGVPRELCGPDGLISRWAELKGQPRALGVRGQADSC